MEWINGEYIISTNKQKLDVHYVHQYLSTQSYWAQHIPEAVVRKSIIGSMCFGLYIKDRQGGFARVITDNATFAYLADVFIEGEWRGRGLSKWMMDVILSHPELQGLRNMMLGTRDAHGLYSKFGFTPLADPTRFMQLRFPDCYKPGQ